MHKLSDRLIVLCSVILFALAAFGAYSNTKAAAIKAPVPTQTPSASADSPVGTLALVVAQNLDEKPHLALIDTDGKNFKTLGDFTNVLQVAWSPDGQHLAFLDESMQIVVIDPDGSNPKTVTKSDEFSYSFTWTADSKQLTFIAYHASDTDGPFPIVSVDLATGKEHTLFTPASAFVMQILWSPDGRLGYMEHTDTTGENEEIHIVDATGSNDQTVVQSFSGLGGAWLMWSPDSAKLAYCEWVNDTPGITITDVTSKESQTIQVHCGESPASAWSPDGTQFAYADIERTNGGLVHHGLSIVNAAGGQSRIIAIPPSDTSTIYSISWRPTVSN